MMRADQPVPSPWRLTARVGILLFLALAIAVALVPAAAMRAAPPAGQEEDSAPYVPGEVLIGWDPAGGFVPRGDRPIALRSDPTGAGWQAAAREIEAYTGLPVLDAEPYFGIARLAVPAGQERAEIRRLAALQRILYAQPNYLIYAADFYPNDPQIGLQWNMRRVYAPAAWDLTRGSASTVVAVIDSGIDLSHPEFVGRLVAGYDYVEGDSKPDDEYGHGTHVSGILAAAANNGIGVAGLASAVRILPIKVLDQKGDGTTYNIAQAIGLAQVMSARIINLSLQSTADPNNALSNAVTSAVQGGVLVVAAAGNSAASGNPVIYPAAYPGVLAVGATDHYDDWASYSGYKPYVALSAPGGVAGDQIYSTLPQGSYGYRYGTSMATPLVSAAAALVWAIAPSATRTQVAEILQQTADKVGVYAYVGGRNDYFGYGRLNVARAVRLAYPSSLSPSPGALSFLLGGPAQQQQGTITLSNPSGQAISWSASVPQGAGWLSVSPTSGVSSFWQPANLTVRVGPTGLAPGRYTGLVRITHTGGIFDIPVQLRVADRLYRVHLPHSGKQYYGMNWIDPATGGQPLSLFDNTATQVTMPFPVTFYGRSYGSVWVSDNGVALFSVPAPAGTFNPELCMPTATAPNDALYVLWHDWKPQYGGGVYVQQPDSDTFVITWNEMRREAGAYPHSFQVVLSRSGQVVFQYRAVDAPLEGTIGIENYDGTLAQQVLCHGAGRQVQSGEALLMNPQVPW